MAVQQTCEIGATLMPLAAGPYSDVWFLVFGKYKTLVKEFFVLCKIT
jgi:hypothetical protein